MERERERGGRERESALRSAQQALMPMLMVLITGISARIFFAFFRFGFLVPPVPVILQLVSPFCLAFFFFFIIPPLEK